jgi:hypothetical protein
LGECVFHAALGYIKLVAHVLGLKVMQSVS